MVGTAKLKKKFKDRWIRSLLSGEYKQGLKRLRLTDNSYCCLGVGCDIEPSGGRWSKIENDGRWVFRDSNTEMIGNYGLSFGFIRKNWFRRDADTKTVDKRIGKLMTMNDTGKTFKQIAAYIKHYL